MSLSNGSVRGGWDALAKEEVVDNDDDAGASGATGSTSPPGVVGTLLVSPMSPLLDIVRPQPGNMALLDHRRSKNRTHCAKTPMLFACFFSFLFFFCAAYPSPSIT